jgi:predicted nucleotidyltransferase
MDYLKINFEEVRNGAMKGTFESLERAFKKFKIDFYLIGAFARDMWLNHLDDLPIRRATLDIDFSIYINDHSQFDLLKSYLVTTENFTEDNEPYRLYSKDKFIVDLIPFGGIEKNDTVYLNGHPPMELSVFGNEQVMSHASVLRQDEGEFKICTLPGLCILKLIAGFERPERREKDLGDFFYILENYFEIAADTLFEGNFDDLIDEDFEPKIASAKMLGRQFMPILTGAIKVKSKIIQILTSLKEGFSDGEIEQMYNLDKRDIKIIRFMLIKSITDEIK